MSRTKKPSAPTNSLLEALKFLSFVTSDEGLVSSHVKLSNNWAVASNSIISAGHKITEDINACPQNKLLIEALSKCGQNLNITQLDKQLSIKSGKFKALIPCIDPIVMDGIYPNQSVANINNEFLNAIKATSVVPEDSQNRITGLSILMNGRSLISTDGRIIIEYWHGIDLPQNIALPKAIIKPLMNAKKNLTAFGLNKSSATFWFEDKSWIKSQLYNEQWPNLNLILNVPSDPKPVPSDLFEGLAAIAPFSQNGMVYFLKGGRLCSHATDTAGAIFEVSPSLPSGLIFSARHLALLKGLVTVADWQQDKVIFFGNKIRGVLAACR